MPQYPAVNPRFPHFLHGGDYNPDQWIATPEVWEEDMRLMKQANCNAMSVGIFSWAALEPTEGAFTFDWLDRIMDMLAANDAFAVLATPSGARPPWLSVRYPEACRVNGDRRRNLHGSRHNHCFTSPAFRKKVRMINHRIAERYKDHPALLVWHVSNEYGGDCHCDLCQEAFRQWLRRRYEDSLDKLNHAWWTSFWGHVYSNWTEIESPSPIGEGVRHGLNLDWKRFVTDQTIDFFNWEIIPLKQFAPGVPVTTNFMGTYVGLDYWKFARAVDVVSWDSYPPYHDREDTWERAVEVSFTHDLTRSLKGGRPFMQMECTPSAQNWNPINKLKRPNVHRTEALQCVAHGADTVQYFQWRKDRGGCEKFHGAVVDHCGHGETRVFREVAHVGDVLRKLDPVIGTSVAPEVAILYDWENRWIIDDIWGPRHQQRDYFPTCVDHYRQFWSRGIPVGMVNEESDFSGYRLLIAPMLYMVRSGVGERIEDFVRNGGTFITTYLSGIADESDLCFLGGWPGPMRKVLGIWSEEIDALYDDESATIVAAEGNGAGLSGTYTARVLCDLIHAEGAEVIATYGSQFYAGRPAVTRNRFGAGEAYYIASRNDERFHADLLGHLAQSMRLRRVVSGDLPTGVTAQMRTDGKREFVFLLNFTRDPREIALGEDRFVDAESGNAVGPVLRLAGNGSAVLVRDVALR